MKHFLHINFRSSTTLFLLIILQIIGCSQDKKSHRSHTNRSIVKKPEISAVITPRNSSVLKCGDAIPVILNFKNNNIKIDSVTASSGNYFYTCKKSDFTNFSWSTNNAHVGQNILKITIFYNDSLRENQSVVVTLLSDIIPKLYKYRLINTYPHDINAYTQGLIYDKGTLLESTGQNGKSSLRRVKIETGEIIRLVNLDSKFFGEGIAIVSDKIYQITWKSQTGFIYSLENFDELKNFSFPYDEGWGLTSNGNDIYMTDGTNNVYVIEPEYFTQKSQFEVFNHKGRMNELNELEYVNGKILANVLGESYILVIDPENGKVTGEIELKDLIPKGFENQLNKVLNGIAYNKKTNRFYVTGKLWPVLYEIEIEGEI